MRYFHLSLLLATAVVCCVSTPLPNVTSSTPSSLIPGKVNNTKLRQDEGDVDEAIAGFETVAGPIGQIITGTLSGNIGQLFSGITGTVTDEAAQPGVGEILTGVSLPLSTLWQNGIAAGTKYFNITTESPLGTKNNATQPQQTKLNGPAQPNANPQQPLLNNQQKVITITEEQLLALQQQNQNQNKVQQPPQVVNEAAAVAPVPVAVETTTQLLEDDDDEDESELRRNNILKV